MKIHIAGPVVDSSSAFRAKPGHLRPHAERRQGAPELADLFGNHRSQRYSLLTQITPDNVKNLELQWVFQSRSLEKFEATPLVVDGVMYTVQAPNDVVALDAATGRMFWTYSYPSVAATRGRAAAA